MRNSLDLESNGGDQIDVVYGYPVRPAAASRHTDYLLWTKTTSCSSYSSSTPSSSSSMSSSDVAPAESGVDHRGKSFSGYYYNKALFSIIISIGILLLAVIFWCAIGETINTHNFPNFEIGSIKVSPLAINGTSVGNWTVGVFVRNTNKYTRMSYDDFQVSVYYKEDQLSKTATVAPLYLGPKEQTSAVASLQLRKRNSATAHEIEHDRSVDGVVNFDVVLQVKMTYLFRFPTIRGKKKVLRMELICLDVQMEFPSPNHSPMMIGGPYRCYSPLDDILRSKS